jgi:CubicO group peptidase (beta-lactamase class C family)
VDNIEEIIDPDSINLMYQYIDEKEIAYTSLIIVKGQEIILEDYFDSPEPNAITALYSATKPINSTLIGIAIDKGFIANEEIKILPYFLDEWKVFNVTPKKKAITLKNILTMSCGFNWNEWEYSYGDPRNVYETWKNSGNRFKFLLDTSMKEMPGKHFNYNTAASNLIPYIINKSTGMSTNEFAQRNLFDPLGINEDNYIWSTDNLGYCKGGGLNMRPTDLAKIGLLYLNEGCWEGETIIPKEWITKSFTPNFDIGLGRKFGYHWYINQYKDIVFYSAEGFMEQKIIIVPGKDLVVVFTGDVQDDFKDNSDIIMKRYILSGLLY